MLIRCGVVVFSGNWRGRAPIKTQRPLFRARRRSLFALWASKPVSEPMARRRDRSFGARTVVGSKIACARKGEEEHA